MAVSFSSSSSTITPITLQPKLITIHCLGKLFPGYSVKSHFRNVSLRRSSVVMSAITGASGTGIGKDTADMLDTVKILDLRGNEIPISDLWKDRKAVVAFARHFGCVLCRKRATYLAEKKDVMDASGVALVLIGPGVSIRLPLLWNGLNLEVYADPDHASYEAICLGVSVTFKGRYEDNRVLHGRIPPRLETLVYERYSRKRRLATRWNPSLLGLENITFLTSARSKPYQPRAKVYLSLPRSSFLSFSRLFSSIEESQNPGANLETHSSDAAKPVAVTLGFPPTERSRPLREGFQRGKRQNHEKQEDTICRMINNRAWTTRLQNSIRDLIPEWDHSLVYNVLHGAKKLEHALQFFRSTERSGLIRHDRDTHWVLNGAKARHGEESPWERHTPWR